MLPFGQGDSKLCGVSICVPLADVRALAERLHGSRLLVLESSGHFPFAEDEAGFIEGVRAFLDEFDERRFLERVGEDR